MKTFSKKEALSFGWNRFTDKVFFLIGLFVITTLISAVTGAIAEQLDSGILGATVNIVDFAIQILVSMGMTLVLLRVYDQVATDYGDLIEPIHLFWKYLVMTILVLVVVLVGLLLFIIPGIIAGIALSMAPYLVIDRNLGPVEAMKESLRITNGHKWNIFIFGIFIFVFNILGALFFGIGLFVTIPVSALASVHIYRWILNPPEGVGVELSTLSKLLGALFAVFVGLGMVLVVAFSGALLQSFSGSPESRDAVRREALTDIKLGTALYKDVYGSYPESLVQMYPEFLDPIPTDPLTGEAYAYTAFEGGFDYEVCTTLEASSGNVAAGLYCEFGLELGASN